MIMIHFMVSLVQNDDEECGANFTNLIITTVSRTFEHFFIDAHKKENFNIIILWTKLVPGIFEFLITDRILCYVFYQYFRILNIFHIFRD